MDSSAFALDISMLHVTSDQVRTFGRFFRMEHPQAPSVIVRVGVSKKVLERFLGSEWFAKHFSSPEHLFFKGCHTPTLDDMAGTRRVWELADMLLNLQRVEGFRDALNKLRDDSVETGFAALEVGKLLFRGGVRFRFVTPQQTKGLDYDYEAYPDDKGPVAIEAKCKLESVTVSAGKIKGILDTARKQLPKEGRGVIVLRVPREWATEGYLQTPFAEVARGVLRNSSRLIGILICSNQFVEAPAIAGAPRMQGSMLIVREFWSDKPAFAEAKNMQLCASTFFDDFSWKWTMVGMLLGEHLTPLRQQMMRDAQAWKVGRENAFAR